MYDGLARNKTVETPKRHIKSMVPELPVMRTLKYLTGDILAHALAVSVVLFLVVFSGRFIRYLAEAAVGAITSDILLPVMLFKLPSFFELILPLGLFIGILLSLGRLYADSELVVLKACGVGPGKLATYLLLPALAFSLVVGFLSLYLAPEGSARAQAMLDNPRSAEGLQQLSEGRFKKQRSGNFVSYAETISDDGVMHNIFVVEKSEAGTARTRVTYADAGEVVVDPENGRRYLELRDGARYEGVPGQADYTVTKFKRYGELIPEREGGIRDNLKTDAISTRLLLSDFSPSAQAALYWRFSLPVLVPVISLIALPLSRTDARRGRYAKLAPALLVFLAYFIGLTQARTAVESGDSGWWFVGVHLIFTLLAVVLTFWEQLSKQLRSSLRG
ncbi:queuine tRNA-ribosyltransferase [Luminiphilus syltensis NOR5-1B]|uniref:Lipopolysaccharide export system permease protein LptF n=2 Tax=Luminiphilus TaxID=1341118 RepID=B8KR05_9GAMM|nr:queuine tRNA-ribosyltransferase [Luminiphilus syltensis NOR5-1B]